MEKENKSKFWKGVLVGALVTAFCGLIIVGVATGISVIGRTVIDNQVEARTVETTDTNGGKQQLNIKQIERKMDSIQSIIDKRFLYEDDLNKIEEGIYRGYMFGLDDPYSVYYNQEEFNDMIESTEGTYCGIGAMVSQNLQTNLSAVVRVFKNSPAEKAGLLPGDILYEVGGTNVTAMELDLIVSKYIRGEEGTSVKLRVLRDETYQDLMVRRAQIEVPTVEHILLEDKTGYVQVIQFDLITTSQFIGAIEDLEKQGMERLIIDMRSNPGGVLDAAVEMAAYIVPESSMDGMIVYTEDKDGKGERYFTKNGKLQFESDYLSKGNNGFPVEDTHQLDLPMAVLVNESSASASELFAGCLKDYGCATIVGTTTFGKGIVQQLIPLEDGSAIKLTTHNYYTPSGYSIHKKGVEPDVEVELNEELKKQVVIAPEEDNQVQKAIEVLKEQKTDS